MAVPIAPGLQTYDVQNGQRYRLVGVTRSVADSDAANALAMAGLVGLMYYPQGSQLPSDWPAEPQLPPLSPDEQFFRAEGTWTSNSSTMPTALTVGSGSIIIYALWQVTPALVPVSGEVPTQNANWMIYLGAACLLGGLAVAMWPVWHPARNPRKNPKGGPETIFIAIHQSKHDAAHAAAKRHRLFKFPSYIFFDHDLDRLKATMEAFDNLLPVEAKGGTVPFAEGTYEDIRGFVKAKPSVFNDAVRCLRSGKGYVVTLKARGGVLDGRCGSVPTPSLPNPRHYETTVYEFGIPIHVHTVDGGYCADYRAIDRLLEGTGAEVCGSSMDEVIEEAKHRVGVLYVRAQHKHGALPSTPPPPRKNDLSPWDDADTIP